MNSNTLAKHFPFVIIAGVLAAAVLALVPSVFAASDSDFNQTINAGTLSVDIVDGSFVTVANPAAYFSTSTFSFTCATSSGSLGVTSTQSIYVSNPDASDNGWTLTIAATGGATSNWDGGATDMDFNDASMSGGCPTDGGDADSIAGQLFITAATSTLSVGNCGSCGTSNITRGSYAGFNEGTTDSITLLTAAAGSDDIGDWRQTNISMFQSIPAEQPATAYTLNMTVTVTGS